MQISRLCQEPGQQNLLTVVQQTYRPPLLLFLLLLLPALGVALLLLCLR
jgi:hypothetical protein